MSSHRRVSSPLSGCFHPSTAFDDDAPPPPPHPAPAPFSGDPNLTTSLYQNHLGVFSLAWSRTLLGHSLHLRVYLHSTDHCLQSPDYYGQSPPSFRLHVKPFAFWRKKGSKKIHTKPEIKVFWDLNRIRFGSGTEPESGFFVAVVLDGEMGLLVGDCFEEAYRKTRTVKQRAKEQVLVLRRENVFGNRVYVTKAMIKGKAREICINCRVNQDAKLCFSIDDKRVLEIKRLKWKFRGNEKIEIDGATIHISWDVYNWLFGHKSKDKTDGCAVFMFRFENPEVGDEDEEGNKNGIVSWPKERCRLRNGVVLWQQCSHASSSSMSSVSSGCSPSLKEWASCTDETELSFGQNNGFSLLVYAWRKGSRYDSY